VNQTHDLTKTVSGRLASLLDSVFFVLGQNKVRPYGVKTRISTLFLKEFYETRNSTFFQPYGSALLLP
jgi:hypothetical protein